LNENKCCNKKTSIGGQALIEGIMMRGPKTTAMAVRNPKGEIVLEQWETESSSKKGVRKIPFVRGIFNFVDSMRFGYKCLMRSAEIAGLEDESPKDEEQTDAEKEPKKEESSLGMTLLMIASVVLGVMLAIGLFVAFPTFLYSLLAKIIPFFSEDDPFMRSAFEGVFKVLILVGYLAAVSLMKDIRRTFMYHGGEHKTIFCYEKGLPLTVENVRAQRRFHPRCGTSFLILMILVSILISMLIPTGIPTYLRVIIKLLLLPLIMGIGYELIRFAGRHDNILTKIISAPGVWLQHLTVFEPDDQIIECAITAMKQVIPDDESDNW
jgi:uncharacterized protein YqhQ